MLPKNSNSLPEALFPGYVFCRINPEVHGLVVTTPGVIRIVSFGAKPAPIDAEEIWSIQISLSTGVYASRYRSLHVGDRVRIESGPLQGVIGSINSIRGKNRLIIGITTLMRSIVLEVDSDWLKDVTPLSSPAFLGDEPGAMTQPFRKPSTPAAPAPVRDGKSLESGAA